MDKFVVGFPFDENREHVLLVRKLRPEWQKGLLNGIGGKIEITENSREAMRRECLEETGLVLDWKHKAHMQGVNTDGHCFTCAVFYAYSQDIFDFEQRESEELHVYHPHELYRKEVVTNLYFLIPYGVYRDGSSFMSLSY